MEEAFAKAVAAAIIAGIYYGVRQVWIKWKISRMSDAELAPLIEEAIDEDSPYIGELVTVRSGIMAGKKGRVVRKDAETITLADSSGREKTISRADL